MATEKVIDISSSRNYDEIVMKLPFFSCILLYLISFALASLSLSMLLLPQDVLRLVIPMLDAGRMLFCAPIPIVISLLLAEFDIEAVEGAVAQRQTRLVRFSLCSLLFTGLALWQLKSVSFELNPDSAHLFHYYTYGSIIAAAIITWFRYAIWALSQDERSAA